MLRELYKAKWCIDIVIMDMAMKKNLRSFTANLSSLERRNLKEAIEDPDILFERIKGVKSLVDKLVDLNMIMDV